MKSRRKKKTPLPTPVTKVTRYLDELGKKLSAGQRAMLLRARRAMERFYGR